MAAKGAAGRGAAVALHRFCPLLLLPHRKCEERTTQETYQRTEEEDDGFEREGASEANWATLGLG